MTPFLLWPHLPRWPLLGLEVMAWGWEASPGRFSGHSGLPAAVDMVGCVVFGQIWVFGQITHPQGCWYQGHPSNNDQAVVNKLVFICHLCLALGPRSQCSDPVIAPLT